MTPGKTEKVTFRCTEDDKKALQVIADDFGVSKSFLLNKGLEAVINQITK
tara:strand:+ start:650 stop:799 length:150 start_codon:yes stop_codon:yes gene_type:complete